MILEIALGIVLGVILLALLPYLLLGGAVLAAVAIAVMIGVLLWIQAPWALWSLAALAAGAGVWRGWSRAVERQAVPESYTSKAPQRPYGAYDRVMIYGFGPVVAVTLMAFIWAEPRWGAAIVAVLGTMVAGNWLWNYSLGRAIENRRAPVDMRNR